MQFLFLITFQPCFCSSPLRNPSRNYTKVSKAEVITADAIERVSTFTWARDKLVGLGLEQAK